MSLQRTPLFDEHKKLGAKLVPFAGWEMPVQYSGVINEHNAVRSAAGLFDVCHMGEIFLEGEEAELAIEELTCNKVSAIYDGKAQYNAIINERGGVVDDIIVYRFNKNKFLICVNASNAEADFNWFNKHNKRKAVFTNKSNEYGLLAIQGPKAVSIITKVKGLEALSTLKPFHFTQAQAFGVDVIAARTGYTGEDGFELFIPITKVVQVWNELLETGKVDGLVPCGLGARDSLRLEAAYPLHGHELSPDVSAIESGLGWIVKEDKADYFAKDLLLNQKKNGAPRSLVGFFLEDSGIARENSKVFSDAGEEIGIVTSGTKTPTLNRALGIALIDSRYKEVGNKVKVQVRDKFLSSVICKLPFYKRG